MVFIYLTSNIPYQGRRIAFFLFVYIGKRKTDFILRYFPYVLISLMRYIVLDGYAVSAYLIKKIEKQKKKKKWKPYYCMCGKYAYRDV